MHQTLYILNILFPVFAMLALGFFFAKINFISTEVQKGLNKLAFYGGLTSMIFLKVAHADINLALTWRLTVTALITMVVTASFTYLMARSAGYPRSTVGALVQMGYRSNMFYIGIPILAFLLDGVMAGSAKDGLLSDIFLGTTPVMIAYNVLAVVVLSVFSDSEQKLSVRQISLNVVRNPLIISAILGGIMGWFKVPVPRMIEKTLSSLMGIAFPLALLGIGFTLAKVKDFALVREVPLGVFAKLIISPLVCFFCATLLGLHGYMLLGVVILLASPSAISSYIMSEQMKCNPRLTAVGVATTTLLSFVTIGIIIYIFSFSIGTGL